MTSESTPPSNSNLSFSLDDFAKALEEHDYEFKKGKVVRGTTFKYESEGAYIEIRGKSLAFLPFQEASTGSITNLAEVLPLGEEQEFLIIREQDAEGQILLSRRQLEIKRAWDELAEIQENGTSVQILITGTNKGGVIGEIKGLRGFIPRSHLTQNNDLESLIGQTITATFLEVNQETNKLVLSQREAARSEVMSKLTIGILMEGTIVSIKPFGVFVDLDGVTGLLHISEVSNHPVASLPALFGVGQRIKVVIIEVDEWRKRISLSTKILENYPGEILERLSELMATAEIRAEEVGEKLQQREQKEQKQ